MKQKIYFKNFDALRAIAALLVVVSHIESQKITFGHNAFKSINIEPVGGIAVTLFFVLSGFLITFLLLNEHKENNKVNIKFFYLRRILRIWPLYFIILILSIIFFNQTKIEAWIYSLFFLPNVAFAKQLLPSVIDPIWSIGIEEQFYIFFPILFLIIDIKKILGFLVGFILVIFAIKFISLNFNILQLRDYFYLARYDCLLLGSVSAIMFYHFKLKNKFSAFFKIIFSTYFQAFIYFLLILYFTSNIFFNTPVIHQIYAILFAIIIMNLGVNQKSIISIENPILNKIGIISYGLYLTHKISNYFILKYLHFQNSIVDNIIIYIVSIFTAIALAYISYYLYEVHFINFKKRFSYFYK